MTKRAFDITFAGFGLLVNLPLMLLAAVMVKLSSPGPVLFRQKRVGLNFQPFEILKFRTMVQDAPKIGAALTVEEDPRVTRVGWWLRMSKVDELPQLINVLRGEMSLVGPRPEVDEYVQLFRRDYEHILTVRPGVTDLASIRFRDEEKVLGATDDPVNAYVTKILPLKIRLAREYIDRQSLLFDLGIVLRTFAQIFLRGGAGAEQTPDAKEAQVAYVVVRNVAVTVTQLALVALSNYLTFQLRFDGHVPQESMQAFWRALPWLVVIRGVVFIPFRMYSGLWRYTSVYDLLGLVAGVGVSAVGFQVFVQLAIGRGLYPRSIAVVDAILLAFLLAGVRIARRVMAEALSPPTPGRRVLVYGAGDLGSEAVREMRQYGSHGYRPIGFIDDDPAKVGRRIHGIRVLGSRGDLRSIVKRLRPDEIVLAVSSTDSTFAESIARLVQEYDVPVRAASKWGDAAPRTLSATQLWKAVAAEISKSRRPVLDDLPIAQLFRGRRVLVTGAAGAVGSELCRQIHKLQPASLVLVDRHERSLRALVTDLAEASVRHAIHPILADVTDAAAMDRLFRRHTPEVVFHSACYTDAELALVSPCETLLNNLSGPRVVAELAAIHGADRFVMMSDTKAGTGQDLVGISMRLAEATVSSSHLDRMTCCCVRFSRVLDVRAAEILKLGDQLLSGGPLLLDRDAPPFMGILADAVYLSLHAATRAGGNAVYELDLGQPIQMSDLAQVGLSVAGMPLQTDLIGVHAGQAGFSKSDDWIQADSEDSSSLDTVVRGVPTLQERSETVSRIEDLERAARRGDHATVLAIVQCFTNDDDRDQGTSDMQSRPVAEVVEESLGAEPLGPPCPKCGSSSTRRSRKRGKREEARAEMTTERPFRCRDCGWRGWVEPVRQAVARPDGVPPPDLEALDALVEADISPFNQNFGYRGHK